MNKNLTKLAVTAVAVSASAFAFADVTTAAGLVTSTLMDDAKAALFAAAGLILGFVVVAKGVSLVINFIRRG